MKELIDMTYLSVFTRVDRPGGPSHRVPLGNFEVLVLDYNKLLTTMKIGRLATYLFSLKAH